MRHEMLRRIHRGAIEVRDGLAGEHVDLRDALDLVSPHLDAHALLLVSRKDLDGVTAHSECAALERNVVSAVLDLHEGAQNLVANDALALRERDHLLLVLHRIAKAINGGYGCDDDDIVALHETRRRAQAQPVDVLVDRGVLLDVRVSRGDVCLGLVVVVIRDEVLDRVMREKAFQLSIELGRERFVVGEYQRGATMVLDDVRHRHGLPGARYAEKRLKSVTALQPARQLSDRSGLIAGRLEGRLEIK